MTTIILILASIGLLAVIVDLLYHSYRFTKHLREISERNRKTKSVQTDRRYKGEQP